MFRALVAVTASFLAIACASDDALVPNVDARGGVRPTSASSAGGAAGANGVAGGNGGRATTATGGDGNGGRAGGAGGNGPEDAAIEGDSGAATTGDASDGARDASSPADARVFDTGGDGDGNPGGDGLPGKPWIHLCPKSDTHEQCCAFLCSCLVTVCADSPLDKPGTDNCMSNCAKLTDMAMRCHVYHCYESLNPRVPQDHVSHCGHASGRVPGGGCPPEVYGP